MPRLGGATLRAWRRSRGWDVPKTAQELRRAARLKGQAVAAHDGLVRMIWAWERGDHQISERYELLYVALGLTHPGSSERRSPVAPAPGTAQPTDAELLALILTGQSGPFQATGDLTSDPNALARATAGARLTYQACEYAELSRQLPRLLLALDAASRNVVGDARLRALALSADAYHVAAGFLLKTGDHGLALLAADRSMRAADASQDPLMIGASARIVTHALMSSSHHGAAVSTATRHAERLDHQVPAATLESRSVYGALLLRAAIAASLDDRRGTALDLLEEAETTASYVGADANYCGTAFGGVNVVLHRVNVAVTLGDAGTAIDLARRIDPAVITVTERKASLLIDTARAYYQWGRYEKAYGLLRAAERTAPQEIAARPVVRSLVRDLVTVAPPSIRREAGEFAAQLGRYP
jgi:tetratricopeptide (TPR) repeat protein